MWAKQFYLHQLHSHKQDSLVWNTGSCCLRDCGFTLFSGISICSDVFGFWFITLAKTILESDGDHKRWECFYVFVCLFFLSQLGILSAAAAFAIRAWTSSSWILTDFDYNRKHALIVTLNKTKMGKVWLHGVEVQSLTHTFHKFHTVSPATRLPSPNSDLTYTWCLGQLFFFSKKFSNYRNKISPQPTFTTIHILSTIQFYRKQCIFAKWCSNQMHCFAQRFLTIGWDLMPLTRKWQNSPV